jgi:hypothetical protein
VRSLVSSRLLDRLAPSFFLPAITAAHRAVVDGKVAYDITTVDQDSQGVMTRLGLRLVTPSAS